MGRRERLQRCAGRRDGWHAPVPALVAETVAVAHLLEALPGPSPDGAPDSLIGDESAVSEALNVAWAMHEIVGDTTEDMLRWLAELNVGFKATSRASVEASSELR